jgi:Recombination endonuclease VII
MTYEWTEKRLRYWKKTLELYQITPTELNEIRTKLIVASDFRCGCCGRDLSKQTVYLDHDHHTGELRGIACFHCNRFGIGGHTLESAQSVVSYLGDPPARKLLPAILETLRGTEETEGTEARA